MAAKLERPKEQRVFVRTSERSLYNECRQAWIWSYVDRREMATGKSVALIMGDLVHRSLAEHYPAARSKDSVKRGPHPAETFAKLYDLMNKRMGTKIHDNDEDKWVNARDLGVEMMTNYVDQWKVDDKDIVIIYPEMPFQFDIYVNGVYLCTYVGTTDALIKRKSTQKYGLFEHKTAAAIQTSHLFMDEQANTYHTIVPLWLAENKILRPGMSIEFMLYNFMRKGMKDTRPRNERGEYLNGPTKEALFNKCVELGVPPTELKGCDVQDLKNILKVKKFNPLLLGEVSKNQPPDLFQRLDVVREDEARQACLSRIISQVKQMNDSRSGRLEVFKSPGKHCGWCQWRDICELHENGEDWKEMARMVTVKNDPYEMHVWALQL